MKMEKQIIGTILLIVIIFNTVYTLGVSFKNKDSCSFMSVIGLFCFAIIGIIETYLVK